MYQPTVHKYSVPFKGNAKEAMAVARTALLSLGFEILLDTDTELQAEGPGMHSKRQPDLLGVSIIHITIDSSQISVAATLGGVTTMKNFVLYFPPILVVSIISLNNLIFNLGIPWLTLLIVIPWMFLAPPMANAMESRIIRAVERLVRGMSQARSSA